MGNKRTIIPGFINNQENHFNEDLYLEESINDNIKYSTAKSRKSIVAILYSISNHGIGELWPLYIGKNSIGRSTTNSVVLSEESVSKEHAVIYIHMTKEGCFHVKTKDCGSTLGTLLNGNEIGFNVVECSNGDVLSFANYEVALIVLYPDQLNIHECPNFKKPEREDSCVDASVIYRDSCAIPQNSSATTSTSHSETTSCSISHLPKKSFLPIVEKTKKTQVNTMHVSSVSGGKRHDVYSSVFAPAEVKPKSRMMVQVYLHQEEETEKVKALATEADRNAERRDYIPLQTKLKKGDKVDVVLNINGDTLLYDCSKSIIWLGSFCKCAFDYLVPSDLDVDELSCSVTLYVNGAIVGEMLFYTQIVDSPAQLNANVIAKPVKKLFISYSHNDLKAAEKIAKLYEGMDVDVFFDKHRLKSGYIYSEEIFNFINKADTFVLCWSENAAQSEYVEKERKAALELAYPNLKPRDIAQISIKPYNIQPYATPPKDMIEHYHFEEL